MDPNVFQHVTGNTLIFIYGLIMKQEKLML